MNPTQMHTVGIIGAGLMGRSIAAAHLAAGLTVKLADSDAQTLTTAVDELSRNLRPSDGTVTAADSPSDLADVDLLIEAVVENLRVKRKLLADVEPHLSDETIVGSNTSTIPISRIAAGMSRPERVCGLHFCHPVAGRLLVEVVRGTSTADATIDRAVAHTNRIGRTAVVVRDAPGFVVNRLLLPYINEALVLLADGSSVAEIESAAIDFGMPWGPLEQLDEIGIDVAVHAGAVLRAAFPQRIVGSDLLLELYGSGRLGLKTGGGLLADNRREIHPAVADVVERHRHDNLRLAQVELQSRLFLPMWTEATRLLHEGVVETAEDVDVALRYGLNFNPPTGSLFGWANSLGREHLAATLTRYSRLGARYLLPNSPLRKAS